MKRKVNAKIMRMCVLCKYWYDPTNAYITPAPLGKNIWEFEPNVKCKCLLKNTNTVSNSNCPKYECKFQIL